MIGQDMEEDGVKMLKESVPVKIEKLANGKLHVTWETTTTEEQNSDVFDTILMAIGKKELV